MDVREQHWLETYKSLITLSLEGFKYLALINGGAVVALLAYLGNVAGKGLPRPDLRCALAYFLCGLAFCGVSMLLAYITQLKLLNEREPSAPLLKSHRLPLHVAMLLYAGSLVAFGIGAWSAVNAFT